MGEPTEVKKPPVGLIPRNISEERWRERRRDEIKGALERYLMDDTTPIPHEWIDEYNSLLEGQQHG